MRKDQSKSVIHSTRDDPLGIDPDKDFDAEVQRIARNAIEGRHREAVQAEVQAALRRWGMLPAADLAATTATVARAPDAEPDPGDEIVDFDTQGLAELDREESVELDATLEKARAIVDEVERAKAKKSDE
ncbi:hypothetical protein [Rhizobium phaseoli]|uniref:hypothetical protein n=1 Tax=Rhizobium phaseoli TaxID=396 RepID=UPI0007E9A6C1|nr:hypothetical protein [Rhizobium phaseoli]ANL42420.1 hypothetical protein AMC88_CH04087 [Rhizobium phaseoli]ANL61406.1 hypothetical protein AMC85_CH04084 [Rhizobium phaseoli]